MAVAKKGRHGRPPPPLQQQKQRQKKPPFRRRTDSRLAEAQEIEAIEARLKEGAPARGSNPLASSLNSGTEGGGKEGEGAGLAAATAAGGGGDAEVAPFVGAKLFEQLPVSGRTKRGLLDAKFVHMTAIQRAALPHALCGRDVLGAAKTGSGKTLAFLIPVVEKLFRMQWGSMDGIGALIISPTRELAVQIFEELRKVGKHHSFSGGLLIGGRKDVDAEKECVNRLNIIVCTPGRLLQHMDETPNFDCSQLQILVLDEADRILDMGFAHTLNAIIAQLPKQRQTLLFSATQTKSVKDLARLSLKDPEYLAVHAESTAATPARLQQTAMHVPLQEKLDMLWSFIKTHLHSKTLVFLSSCKQVKFVHESFKRLRPGVPLKCLHGRMKQAQRMLVFFDFCKEKHSVLFATDVAARGLDFPAVEWVVQVDCPEDVPSYIHRVGRTARYTSRGHSVLFLAPSEAKMIDDLHAAKIPIKIIKVNHDKVQRVSGSLGGLLSKDPDLKYMAQRAFVTYVKSIHLRGNKEIFDVTKLPVEEYALSLGLPTTPRIRVLEKGRKNTKFDKSAPRKEVSDDDNDEEERQISSMPFSIKAKQVKVSTDFPEDKLLMKKRAREEHEAARMTGSELPTRVTKKKLKINPDRPAGKRFVFDEEGNAVPPLAAFAKSIASDKEGNMTDAELLKEAAQERYEKLKQDMMQRDKEDKLLEKQRLRDKRHKKKFAGMADDGDGDEEEGMNKKTKLFPQKRYFADETSDDELSQGGRSADEDVQSNIGSLSLSLQESIALNMLKSRQS